MISATPFIFQSLMTFVGGWYTDKVRSKGWVRTVTIRKFNTILGLIVPAVTVVLAGYSGCNAFLAITLFTLSVGFSAFTIPGNKARYGSSDCAMFRVSKYFIFQYDGICTQICRDHLW